MISAIDASFAEAGKYLVGLNALDGDGNLIVASEPSLITIPTPEPIPTAEVIPVAPPAIDPAMQGERAPGLAVLQGTGEPGSDLEITVDGVTIGRITVDAEGNWSLPTRFNNKGVYAVRANALDAANETSDTSDPVVIVIPEPTPTPLPPPAATPVPPSFELPDDLSVGDLTLTGTGMPNSTMELLIDNRRCMGY